MIVAVGIATYNEFLFDQPGVYRQPVQGQEEFVYSWWLPSASMTNTPVGSQRAKRKKGQDKSKVNHRLSF